MLSASTPPIVMMQWTLQVALTTWLLCSTVTSRPEPQMHLLDTPTDRARRATLGDVEYLRGTLRLQPYLEPGTATSCVNEEGLTLSVPNYFIRPDGRVSNTRAKGSLPANTMLHAVSVPRELGYLCGASIRIALSHIPSADAKVLTSTWGVVWDICEECVSFLTWPAMHIRLHLDTRSAVADACRCNG